MPTLHPTKILYIDTEFTSLGEPWPVEIISIGVSDSLGNPVFYAENADYDPRLASDFTRERVIPLLDGGQARMDFPELLQKFWHCIGLLGPCVFAADSDWDWLWIHMFAQSSMQAVSSLADQNPLRYACWPENLCPFLAKINFHALCPSDQKASWAASEAFFKDRFQHHALNDARANALCAAAAIENNAGRQASNPIDFCSTFKQALNLLAWKPSTHSQKI